MQHRRLLSSTYSSELILKDKLEFEQLPPGWLPSLEQPKSNYTSTSTSCVEMSYRINYDCGDNRTLVV